MIRGERYDTADIQLTSRLLGGLAAAESFYAGEANVHMHFNMRGLPAFLILLINPLLP